MNAPDVTEGIVPIGEFKTHISKMARRLRETHRPIVVTQNGKSAMVVLSPEEYERLTYHDWVRAMLARRIRESESLTDEDCVDHETFMQQLEAEFGTPEG